MALKKWKKNESTWEQFGSILFNFVVMLIVKIIVYLFLKQAASYVSKCFSRFGFTKASDKETANKDMTQDVNREEQIEHEKHTEAEEGYLQGFEQLEKIVNMKKTKLEDEFLSRMKKHRGKKPSQEKVK